MFKDFLMTETEQYVIEAMSQLSKGNDGDETYHPLYKAWRSYQSQPSQLKNIKDYGQYGMGLLIFLSYGTITDIDDQQQIASLAYFFISKAIQKSPDNINLYKNRVLLLKNYHNAFEYTVSSVVNNNETDPFDLFFGGRFTARDAIYKMTFSDLHRNPTLLQIDVFSENYNELCSKISTNFFGNNETTDTILAEGNAIHNDILTYLETKVFIDEDFDF